MLKIQVLTDKRLDICGEQKETPVVFICSLNYYKDKIGPIHNTWDVSDLTITPYASSIGKDLD